MSSSVSPTPTFSADSHASVIDDIESSVRNVVVVSVDKDLTGEMTTGGLLVGRL